MIDKRAGSVAEALDRIRDGAVVLLGGFGAVGQANELVEGLIEQGARDLTIVANNAGSSERGLPQLLAAGRVRRVVCSFPRGGVGSSVFEELFKAGKVELEIVPQDKLRNGCERLAPEFPLSIRRQGSAQLWPRAKSCATLTAAHTCWNMHCLAISR